MSASNDGHEPDDATYNQPQVKPYQNRERLKELYHEQDLTQYEIGEKFNIDQTTVHYWLDKFDLLEAPKTFYRREMDSGKIRLEPAGTDEQSFYIHQVVALEDYSVSEVFDEDNHVHHMMGSPQAVDVPENLEVLEGGEHVRRHAEGTATVDHRVVLEHMTGEFEPVAVKTSTATGHADD